MNNSEYRILFNPKFIKKPISDTVINKFLQDILKAWNVVSINTKGTGLYSISILVPDSNMIKSQNSEEPMLAYFKIKSISDLISNNINELEKISGAVTMNVTYKEKTISLGGIKQELKIINEFELNSLIDRIKQITSPNNNSSTISYIKRKIYELQITEGELQAQKNLYDKVLKEYLNSNTGTAQQQGNPQATTQKEAYNVTINEDFFQQVKGFIEGNANHAYCQKLSDKLIKTGLQFNTIESQIKYYIDLLKNFEENKNIINNSQLNTEIKKRCNDVYEKLCVIAEQINFFYKSLSSYNLLPKNTLYSIEYSSINVAKSNIKKLLITSVIAWIFLELIIISGVLLAVKFKNIE